MGIFGSNARGEATENSDIDIAVELWMLLPSTRRLPKQRILHQLI
jgi:predicted nucleotidyltransferase